MRYLDFLADDIKADIQKAVSAWGLDRDGLNARCRRSGRVDGALG